MSQSGSYPPVIVLLGGPSAEHDVSIVSGTAIAEALANSGLQVRQVVIDLDGWWWWLPLDHRRGDRSTADYDDLLALGVLQAMYAAGVGVPDDLAIVGYDDIEFAAAAAVPLTSVRQPAVTMGAMAADLLLEETEEDGAARAHEHRRVVLQPELVVRRSSLSAR